MEYDGGKMDKRLFRRSLFGGLNKNDVEGYISVLEDEIRKLKKLQEKKAADDKPSDRTAAELDQLRTDCADLQKQLKEMEEKQKSSEDEAAQKEKENQALKEELEKVKTAFERYAAEVAVGEERKAVYREAQKESGQSPIDFITVKYKISDYKDIERVRENLLGVTPFLSTASKGTPDRAAEAADGLKKEK